MGGTLTLMKLQQFVCVWRPLVTGDLGRRPGFEVAAAIYSGRGHRCCVDSGPGEAIVQLRLRYRINDSWRVSSVSDSGLLRLIDGDPYGVILEG